TLPLGVFLIVSLIPSPALAFEASLAISPSPQIMADVKDFDASSIKVDLPETLPAYSSADVAAVATAPSPITEKGSWGRGYRRVATVRPVLGSPIVLEGQASYYSRAG